MHCSSCGHESVLPYESRDRGKTAYREAGKDHRHIVEWVQIQPGLKMIVAAEQG